MQRTRMPMAMLWLRPAHTEAMDGKSAISILPHLCSLSGSSSSSHLSSVAARCGGPAAKHHKLQIIWERKRTHGGTTPSCWLPKVVGTPSAAATGTPRGRERRRGRSSSRGRRGAARSLPHVHLPLPPTLSLYLSLPLMAWVAPEGRCRGGRRWPPPRPPPETLDVEEEWKTKAGQGE
jgi:hypothetical protein